MALKVIGFSDGSTASLLSLLRWPLLFAAILLALACLYRFGPSRERPQWRWVTWGSAVAAGIWIGGSLLLSWYVANFGSYNATYGSLGAIIGLLVWMWLSTTIVLAGAEINAETIRPLKIVPRVAANRLVPEERGWLTRSVRPARDIYFEQSNDRCVLANTPP